MSRYVNADMLIKDLERTAEIKPWYETGIKAAVELLRDDKYLGTENGKEEYIPREDEDTPRLLHCPFCGGEAIIRVNSIMVKPIYITCSNPQCNVVVVTKRCETKENAAKLWNERHYATRQEDDLY